MFITHTSLCLYSVTRMTQSRHYCVSRIFRGLTSFACLSFVLDLSFLSFSLLKLRPVLHYEVFKVPLCFSATACLVYTAHSFLSRAFLDFFKSFFALS